MEDRMLDHLADLSFWLEVVAALGMNSAPSSNPIAFLFLSKAKTEHPQHHH
jgi:hypothetical protein